VVHLNRLLSATLAIAPSTAFAHGAAAEPIYAMLSGAAAGVIAGIVCWGKRNQLPGCVAAGALGLAGLMYIICLGPSDSGASRSLRQSAEDAAGNWIIFALPTFIVLLVVMLGLAAAKARVSEGQSVKDDNAS
jgi:succinate-acetate transporter protein